MHDMLTYDTNKKIEAAPENLLYILCTFFVQTRR